jgi:hypothetical protein
MIREAPKAPPVYGQDGTSRFDPLPSASGAEKATIAVVAPTLSPNREGDMPLEPDDLARRIIGGLYSGTILGVLGRLVSDKWRWWLSGSLAVGLSILVSVMPPSEIINAFSLRDALEIAGGSVVGASLLLGLAWRGVKLPFLPGATETVAAPAAPTPLIPWVRAFLIDAELNRTSGSATAKIGLVTNAPDGTSLHSATIQGALDQLAPISLRLQIGPKRYNFTAPSGVARLEIPPGAAGASFDFTMAAPEKPTRIGLTDDTTDARGEGAVVTQNLGELPVVGTVRITGQAG